MMRSFFRATDQKKENHYYRYYLNRSKCEMFKKILTVLGKISPYPTVQRVIL